MAITLLPGEGEKARQAWITYSTPLWRGAGRSQEWISQNIETEWASSKQDIMRRYLAGDFAKAIAKAKEATPVSTLEEIPLALGLQPPGVKEWLEKHGGWIGVGLAGIVLLWVIST